MVTMSVQAKTGETEASGSDQGSIKSCLQSTSDSGGNGLHVVTFMCVHISAF